MRKIFTYLLLPGLFSCATSSITTQNLDNSQRHYAKILTCVIDKPLVIHEFDSAFYETSVKENFNDLGNIQVRNQLEKTLKRNLESISTEIVRSSDLFSVNEITGYSRFKEKIEKAGVEAILLINEESSWDTPSYQKVGHSIQYNGQPNTAFHCYLIDVESGRVVWLGRCVVNGVYAGYDTLNNTLARKVAKKLRETGRIQ